MSSILYGPGTETFAVVVLNRNSSATSGPAPRSPCILTLPPLTRRRGRLRRLLARRADAALAGASSGRAGPSRAALVSAASQ